MMPRGLIRLACSAWLLLTVLVSHGARSDDAIIPLSDFPRSQLAIRTAAGSVHAFKIWIADNQARDMQGLMFVKHIDDHEGMLFVYPDDRVITMWMKNTFIPLDMVFISADGHVAHIEQNTLPQSLDIVSAPQMVRAVLEINAGVVERLQIKVGDRVSSHALVVTPSRK
jgi:uncharacterized protein